MNIPKQFEFMEVYHQFTNRPEAPVFVTVLETFKHHYTGEEMYHVRLEHDGTFGLGGKPSSFVEYKAITEDVMVDMLAKRKPVGCSDQ